MDVESDATTGDANAGFVNLIGRYETVPSDFLLGNTPWMTAGLGGGACTAACTVCTFVRELRGIVVAEGVCCTNGNVIVEGVSEVANC